MAKRKGGSGLLVTKILALGLAGGALYVFTRPKMQQTSSQVSEVPKANPCSPEAVKAMVAAAAANTAQGAATGAPAGGAGAGAGAALGFGMAAAANPNLLKCGLGAFNDAKAKLCTNAKKVVQLIRAKGGHVPGSFDALSCDQKIAFVAALAPFGALAIPMLVGGVLVGSLVGASANELNRAVNTANDKFKQVFRIDLSKSITNIFHL